MFFALKGAWLLIVTEDSIKVQCFFSFLVIIAGFYFQISSVEWMMQLMCIGLVLVSESLNTGIEKMADFVHPNYDKKIGFIKDVSAGASTFAVIISLIISGIIYIPKIRIFFF